MISTLRTMARPAVTVSFPKYGNAAAFGVHFVVFHQFVEVQTPISREIFARLDARCNFFFFTVGVGVSGNL